MAVDMLRARRERPRDRCTAKCDDEFPSSIAPYAAAFTQGPERDRLCRRPERGDRVPLGRTDNTTASRPSPADLVQHRAGGRRFATPGDPVGCASGRSRHDDDSDRLHGGRGTRSELGLVASLARPGGNATGINAVQRRAGWPSGCGLLHDLVPTATYVSPCSLNPAKAADAPIPNVAVRCRQRAAHSTSGLANPGLQRQQRSAEIEAAFAQPSRKARSAPMPCSSRLTRIPQQPSAALIVAALAARQHDPLPYTRPRDYVAVWRPGELRDRASTERHIAKSPSIPGESSEGAKPADLPVAPTHQIRVASSTCKRRERLASRCRQRCSPSPTR